MERLGIWLQWNKSRPENRSLLLPQEDKRWTCIFPSLNHQRQENRDSSCWPYLKWISLQAKSRPTSCCGKDQGPKSKVHPLASRVIRRRNTHPPQRTKVDYKSQKEGAIFSWSAFKMNLCHQNHNSNENKECSLDSQIMQCCTNHSKCKWGIGLSILDIWPKNTCNFRTHTQNLRSIITTPSSWCWFQSSNSIFQDFLEDIEILKNIDAKDLNEYRELLLNEPLTYERLQHYSKIVLRVFVYLLRNQQPPKFYKKKTLIRLCTKWTCKNKNYFCTFEKKANEFLKNACKNRELISTPIVPISFKNAIKWTSMKENRFKFYATNDFQVSNGNHKGLTRSMSDTKTIKLMDESMFEDKKKLVYGNDQEKCDGWGNNEDAESFNIFQGFQETFCPCFTCSNDDTFCYGCMCTICKDTGTIRDSIFWLKCTNCIHVAHLQCAIKVGFVGFNSIRKLDGEYWCQSCDAKVDLVPYWQSLLQEASKCNDMSRLELLLYCAMSILKDTKRSKYKDLQSLVYEAWGLIASGAQSSDIHILVDIICTNFESTNQSKLNQSINLHMRTTNHFKTTEDDIAGVQETINEVEAWKNILSQTEEQLKRLKLNLEVKTKNTLISNTTSNITKKFKI